MAWIVTAYTPHSAAPGASLSFTGADLNLGTGNNIQLLDTSGAVVANFTFIVTVNNTLITANVPAVAPGLYWIRATDIFSGGSFVFQGANALTITAVPAPTVSNVSPNTGPVEGGTAVTITGTGFASGATLTIGGVPATGVTFVNSTTLTVVSPAGTLGAASVVVTNPDAQFGTLVGGYTYLRLPPVYTRHGTLLQNLLPPGRLWSLEGDSNLHKILVGAGDEFARIEARGVDLINESDPRTATETLPDWERVLGLPDERVLAIPGTTAGRRVAVTAKYIAREGQNLAFFSELTAACGYPLVSIEKFASAMLRANTGRVGDRVFGTSWAYAIRITVSPATTGALTHAEFERVIRHVTHAHIIVVFVYL